MIENISENKTHTKRSKKYIRDEIKLSNVSIQEVEYEIEAN